jgi:rubredoxin
MISYRIDGHYMEINFECQKCGTLFDCEIGTVTIAENSDKPDFEKEIICPKCGGLSMDEVLLTEIGQSQLTEVIFDFDADDIFDFEGDELKEFGFYEGECPGCDLFSMLNDFGLCEECTGKLERDLLRQRDWDYSALTYGIPAEKREALRNEIIRRYGRKLELISPKEAPERKRKKKRQGKRKKGRGKR